ncbi:MAG: hypothetical protein J6A15_08365 [Clostridia bacterium]|nr:hypothetical protein [Clostridia bacterium]
MIRKFILNNKEIEFKIYNPGGNKTALVYDKNYEQYEISKINNYILSNYPQIEQVGFISKENNTLKMAGGEFCVNATRCTIYDFLEGKDGETSLSVSGAKNKLYGGITENTVFVKIDFKNVINSISIKLQNNILNGYMAKLDGIEHVVLDYSTSKNFINLNEVDLKKICKEIIINSNSTEKAVGVILLKKVNDMTKIYPIVWVRSIDTLYYETACGSGTIAAFTYLYNQSNVDNISILQPSGYTLKVEKKDSIVIISGPVIEE